MEPQKVSLSETVMDNCLASMMEQLMETWWETMMVLLWVIGMDKLLASEMADHWEQMLGHLKVSMRVVHWGIKKGESTAKKKALTRNGLKVWM